MELDFIQILVENIFFENTLFYEIFNKKLFCQSFTLRNLYLMVHLYALKFLIMSSYEDEPMIMHQNDVQNDT